VNGDRASEVPLLTQVAIDRIGHDQLRMRIPNMCRRVDGVKEMQQKRPAEPMHHQTVVMVCCRRGYSLHDLVEAGKADLNGAVKLTSKWALISSRKRESSRAPP
jgi:hypothetical protein